MWRRPAADAANDGKESRIMDDKLNETLKGMWDSLTDEQKEMAKTCRTTEELTAFAGREGIELPDEVLDAVAGGYVYYDPSLGRWAVIGDKHGELLWARDKTVGDAKRTAQSRGQSTEVISKQRADQIWKDYEKSLSGC